MIFNFMIAFWKRSGFT